MSSFSVPLLINRIDSCKLYSMHIKVGDPAMKSLPAALMLLMSLIILYTHG